MATGRVRSSHPVDVIVADDDLDDQYLLVLAAEEAGVEMELTFVDDGVELMTALGHRVAEGRLPDLVVVDLRMPRVGGHRCLELIADDEILSTIPTVVLSSSTRAADRERAIGEGAIQYEVKPTSYRELVGLCARWAALATARPAATATPR